MAHLHDAQQQPSTQDGNSGLGPRACLLKGCEKSFQPQHHLSRYCSEECVRGAKAWRRWVSDKKYRATDQARELRRQQSQRYRQRCKEREIDMNDPVDPGSEGDTKGKTKKKSYCDRPGCYERFTPKPQSPHQKYCSPDCYKAMRRVLIREKRWRERLGLTKKGGREGPAKSPPEGLSE